MSGAALTVTGGCHCGAVRWTAQVPPEVDVLDCNCSICAKTGYLHMIVPGTAFRLLTPWSALTEYRFGTGNARHLFCAVCGVKSAYVPRSHPDGYSLNLRAVDDPAKLAVTVVPFDGRHWEQARQKLG